MRIKIPDKLTAAVMIMIVATIAAWAAVGYAVIYYLK
jgi:hypothetical protein